MAKKSWFGVLKRFFVPDTRSNRKKEKKRIWLFGKHKARRLPLISAPSVPEERIPTDEKVEEQMNVAANSVVTTDSAAEVVELTERYESYQLLDQEENKTTEVPHVVVKRFAPEAPSCQCERQVREAATIKIQTAFRGYLARKALRALKGLVSLQAIIRGRAVRRQAITTLKRLQSIVNIQTQVCARRIQMAEETPHENKELYDFRGKDIKIDVNSQRRWDDSILTKEEETALFTSKREAAMMRERIKEYAFNHRWSTESEQNKVSGKWRYWLEQWVDTQLAKQEDIQTPDAVSTLNNTGSREALEARKLKLRNLKGLDSPTFYPRRSFHHRKQHSIGDRGDNSFTGSPVFPTYMAATESARAKARSMSSPRPRPISLDTCSDTTPYKHKLLSPISSINSDATSISRITASIPYYGSFSQRSPSLKGVPGPVKSKRSSKDLGFNSECSLPNWDRHDAADFK